MDEIVAKEEAALHRDHAALARLLRRLDGITGFVSILGGDPRVHVFRRSSHVRRVVWFTSWLCDRFPAVDRSRALLITWCHDMNRLPFAHNLEKAVGFDQSENLPAFLARHGINLPGAVMIGLQQMLNKGTRGQVEARLVYAADSVTGFIEDPLLAVSTLGVPLTAIPQGVADHLGLDPESKTLRDRIQHLTHLFHSRPEEYTPLLEETVFSYGTAFLDRHNHDGQLFVDLPDFHKLRQILKEHFLRRQVFPINNEQVSQGSRLADEVGKPLMKALRREGRDPVEALLEMTDQEALDAAVARGLVDNPASFYPRLAARVEERERVPSCGNRPSIQVGTGLTS